MRDIDPFSYFPNHTSAIPGLGGDRQSPDPRYCFHTQYIDVRPGPARYELLLPRVRASYGQLALRVHAYRPDTGENASLVAGARLDVAVDEAQDLRVSVLFSAMRNVQYAFYGFFIEHSDIEADGLSVALQEFEGEVEDIVDPPRSILALNQDPADVRPANALIHVVTPHLVAPVSQDCTWRQLYEIKDGDLGPDGWAEALCLNALRFYEVTQPALEGLVVGACSDGFVATLREARFAVEAAPAIPPPPPTSGLFADFVVWPEGLLADPDPAARWYAIKSWFGRVKIGGIGIVTCRYRPDDAPVSSLLAIEGTEVSRNEIGKWALRLIGEGYSVAPLAFSPSEDCVLDAEGLARFAIIARRL